MTYYQDKPSFWRYENFIVFSMFFTYGFVMMDRFSIMYLFPFIAPDLKLNNTEIGLIVSILSICWAISSYLFSSLSDIFSAKKKFLVAVVLVFSIASISSGLATTFTAMMIVRGLMGIAEGPVVPLAQAAVLADSTPYRRGFNMGVIQSSTSLLGLTLGPVIVIGLAQSLNWHYAFYLLALPGLIVAFILMSYMKEPVLTSGAHVRPEKSDYLKIFKHRNIWLGVLMSIGFMASLFASSAFIPLYFEHIDRYSQGQISLYLGTTGLAMFVSQLLIAWISDHIGRKLALIISAFIAIFGYVAVLQIHTFPSQILVGVLLSLGMGFPAIFMAIVPSESVPKPFVATAMSLIILVGELGGGTVIPIVAGALADKNGLAAPMWLAVGGAIWVFLLSFGLKETAPRKLKKLGNVNPLDLSSAVVESE